MSHEPVEYGIAPPLHEPPRSPKWPWVMLLVVVLLVGGVLTFGRHVEDQLRRTFDPVETTTVAPEPPVPATRVVVFEVAGTGTAFNITATVGATVFNQASVPLPWTKTVEVPADAAAESVMLVVVAGADGAEVHGKYTVDGKTVREGKASGPYGVLTITDR
ncbi:MmpS family transport accessory protein [Lentzea sp. NPDC006480]|uniref:MmpS family transport accessory protein n=1 Tax=Lentzea sp. NPDC006480 TaxID=3157176 RepID=UPI0033BEBA86